MHTHKYIYMIIYTFTHDIYNSILTNFDGVPTLLMKTIYTTNNNNNINNNNDNDNGNDNNDDDDQRCNTTQYKQT